VEPVLVLAEQFGDIGEQDVGGIGPPSGKPKPLSVFPENNLGPNIGVLTSRRPDFWANFAAHKLYRWIGEW
jgi:hypothetical protein